MLEIAEDDKKKKQEVEVKNSADQSIYQTEKILKESADKLSADEKNSLQTKVDELKKVVQSNDIESIKAKQESLQKELYAVSEKIYKSAAQSQSQTQGAQNGQSSQNSSSGGQNSSSTTGGEASGSDDVVDEFD